MIRDTFDHAKEQWERERPDLDASGVEVVWRISFIHKQIKKLTSRKLNEFDLPIWSFDVLATLRRSGSPYRVSPTELCEATFLTSGAMTNRLDRMEEAGLVERLPDPDDRRGVLVQLTAKGHQLVDEAATARFDQANDAVASLTPKERALLSGLLRKLVVEHNSE